MAGGLAKSGQTTSRSSSRRKSSRSNQRSVKFDDEIVPPSEGSSSAEDNKNRPESHAEDGPFDQEKIDKIWEKLNTADPWPIQFANVIRERQSGLNKKLTAIKEESAWDKQSFEAEIAPLLQSALGGFASGLPSDPPDKPTPIHVQFLGAEGQMYCDAMVNLLKQSGALLFAYDELAGRPAYTSRLQETRTSFEKDKGVSVSSIEAGKKITGMEIEKLLADKFHEVRDLHGLTIEEEQKGRMLLSHGTDQQEAAVSKQTPGWGNIARDTEMAIERLCFAGHGQASDR
ncbi:hypothetical protein AYL99_03237 [Fonsecaea erecta]|uniref:Uncharacterized protein n=1 Tax=Fonsecaea erecta TaxID=1367422 RepID=A0A178ZW33_9EURO|nr:hypothetical protein AYL99_03237 [Fonsecaea erecta]OAP64010.1 hypothetical protein AYL99_03237 [Fonsecaea erecta]